MVDIGLDPFPFNGATTTCEALWMGVPVVTLSGSTHASRVGASILRNVNLDEFVTYSAESYLEKAVKLASNLNYLQDLRHELRNRMLNSKICDGYSFARDIECAYRKIFLSL